MGDQGEGRRWRRGAGAYCPRTGDVKALNAARIDGHSISPGPLIRAERGFQIGGDPLLLDELGDDDVRPLPPPPQGVECPRG